MNPEIVCNILPEDYFESTKKWILDRVNSIDKRSLSWMGKEKQRTARFDFDPGLCRWLNDDSLIRIIHNRLTGLVREKWGNQEILPTYSVFCHYEKYMDLTPNLPHHKDDNACTYTVDITFYANTPWPLWVENKEYVIGENCGLVYLGEEQEHWREDFPDRDNNCVGVGLFHYANPDHWWFTNNKIKPQS